MPKYKLLLLAYALLMALVASAILYTGAFLWSWILVAITLALFGVLFYFSMKIGSGFFVEAVTKTANGKVLLTFDDGPHPEFTPGILDILNREGVKAVFFMIGREAETYRGIMSKVVEEGHGIGIHSYAHKPSWGWMSRKQVAEDLRRCKAVLEQSTGGRPVNMFRPPYGVTNPNIADIVRSMELRVIGWDVRSFDTVKDDPHRIVEKVLQKVKAGSIILLHDRLVQTREALPAIIEGIKQKGLSFGTINDI